MKSNYATAFLSAIDDGMSVAAALTGLKKTLAKKKHEKLLASILHEVLRTLESKKETIGAVVRIAHKETVQTKKDIAVALAELNAPADTSVVTVVDATLIGGFVVRYNNKERDYSYKTALKSLYESIITNK